MSPPIQKLDPSQIGNFSSLQTYQKQCQAAATRNGQGEDAFDPTDVHVANRSPGDGQFQILGNNSEKDFFCSAQVNWQSHEMLIDSGTLSTRERKPVGALWMTDACSLTRSLAGEEELGGRECRDDMLDSRLPAISQMESVQFFFKACNESLKQYGEPFGRHWENEVRPERVFLLNQAPRDGEFSFLFASSAYGFSCEGHVSTLEHNMRILAGNPNKPEEMGRGLVELTDACTVTRKAFGESEWVGGECQDRTQRERNIETGLGYTWNAFWAGLGIWDVVQLFRKGWKQTLLYRTGSALRHPIQTWSRFASWAQGSLSKVGPALSAAGAALTRAGTALRALGGLRATGWLGRIPSFLGGAGAAAGGGEAAAGGGTMAAGGVSATAGAAALGFAIGFGIGTLIEYTPRWLGAKKSVSDGIAWGIDSGVGIASWGASLVTDKSTQDIKKKVTDFNINVLEHMGFGGWNVFKNSWGLA